MKIKKKRCPYCTTLSPPVCMEEKGGYQVECFACGVRGPYGNTMEEAWERWGEMLRKEDREDNE